MLPSVSKLEKKQRRSSCPLPRCGRSRTASIARRFHSASCGFFRRISHRSLTGDRHCELLPILRGRASNALLERPRKVRLICETGNKPDLCQRTFRFDEQNRRRLRPNVAKNAGDGHRILGQSTLETSWTCDASFGEIGDGPVARRVGRNSTADCVGVIARRYLAQNRSN